MRGGNAQRLGGRDLRGGPITGCVCLSTILIMLIKAYAVLSERLADLDKGHRFPFS